MTATVKPLTSQKRPTRNQRRKCDCGGYWFPHRRASGTCYSSPSRDYLLAIRLDDQEAILEALVDRAFMKPSKATREPCPF